MAVLANWFLESQGIYLKKKERNERTGNCKGVLRAL